MVSQKEFYLLLCVQRKSRAIAFVFNYEIDCVQGLYIYSPYMHEETISLFLKSKILNFPFMHSFFYDTFLRFVRK